MRYARLKLDHAATWYHCYNRIAGTREDLPFGVVEKEQFVRLLRRVSSLYSVKVVAYQVMSNHFHLLVYAPAEAPGPEEMCRRFATFHRGKRTLEPGTPACRKWQHRSRDISWFMRHLQQLFTRWYNRTRPVQRRGSLWADRFKHTLLESGTAVWACWTYIENNPVRAGMVKTVADYRFCSHGYWMQSGRHPYARNVRETGLPMLRALFGIKELADIRTAMEKALAGKANQATQAEGFTLCVQRRVRHWTDGLVIGSQLFVKTALSHQRRESVSRRHRMARAESTNGPPICCWRRLRTVESG